MISSRWPRPDGYQAVERLDAGLHRLLDRLARDDAGRLHIDARALIGLDRTAAVDRVAQRVDDAAKESLADRHVDDGAGALDDVAFLDVAVITKDDDADVVGLEVQRHPLDTAGKFDHLAGLHLVEAVDASDAVADREYLADLGDLGLGAEAGDLLLNNRGDFRGADIHYPIPFIARCNL